MTPLVPIMLYGWPLFSLYWMSKKKRVEAVSFLIIMGVSFLPMYSFSLPVFPEYGKYFAITLGLVLGVMLIPEEKPRMLVPSSVDWFMFTFCFISPVGTALANGLSLASSIFNILSNIIHWGIYYWVGRKFFHHQSDLRVMLLTMLKAGSLYLILALYEIRFSPQLSVKLYGFFAHDFGQHFRYGGYRPIIFMEHGLMVSLWMVNCTLIALWFWREKQIDKLWNIKIQYIALLSVVVTILCKSANGWILLSLGVMILILYQMTGKLLVFSLLLFVIPGYYILRLENILSVEIIRSFASGIFDYERVSSMTIRLIQEDLFNAKTLLRPIWGWGRGRGWPVDPFTGQRSVRMVDALTVIIFNISGYVGLISLFGAVLAGPIMFLKNKSKLSPAGKIDGILISTMLIFWTIDSMQNGMKNPVYILAAGALVSYIQGVKTKVLNQELKDSDHESAK